MAGTFTHWMVAEEALDRCNALPNKHEYFPIVLDLNHFVCLGAVGPDYPYLTELLGGFLKMHSWADRMHYENTGAFVQYAIKNLLRLSGKPFNTCLAWLCGFASHLVTDSVVHPVVQAIVGPYIFNSGEHRHCELTQDSYIFREIKGVEINYAQYAGLFVMCSDPKDQNKIDPDLRLFWTETLEAAHPTATSHFNDITPDRWHEHFLSKIALASHPIPVFRHFAEEKNLAYKETKDITQGEWQSFVRQVKLPPGNKTGDFRQDVFEKAVAAVVDAWQRLFVDIKSQAPNGPLAYIKNWNLDTGVDEDKEYFWP